MTARFDEAIVKAVAALARALRSSAEDEARAMRAAADAIMHAARIRAEERGVSVPPGKLPAADIEATTAAIFAKFREGFEEGASGQKDVPPPLRDFMVKNLSDTLDAGFDKLLRIIEDKSSA